MQNQNLEDEMRVQKRNGTLESVSFDKILHRIKTAGNGLKVNFTSLAMKVIDQLYDTISATKIDELSAEQCASMTTIHQDYNILAGRIIISNHHKNTDDSFSTVMEKLYQYKDKQGLHSPLISEELYTLSTQYASELNDLCDYERDYLIDYFGFKTLERAYLMKVDKRVLERPQHMWLRDSIGIHGQIANPEERMAKIKETYEYMSKKYFTHATPTLFNAGTPKPQLSSCYLLSMESDSIDGIYNTLKDCALISKHAGGIGLHIHNIRATGSHIRGTNGTSNGIVPMLRVFNNTAKYVDQCVTADSIIFTTEGPIEIASCIPGVTSVFGRTGQPETISQVLEYPHDGDLYVIQSAIQGAPPLRITDEHPIYVLPNSRDNPNVVNDLELGIIKPMWLEAKHVTDQDLLVYSTPQYEYDILMYTEDACFIYGILISNNIEFCDGYFEVTFTSTDEMKDVTDYFDAKYIEYTLSEDGVSVEWATGPSNPFTRNDFFNYEGKKRVGKWWLFLPEIKTQKIVEGIYRNKELKDLAFCPIETIWWSLRTGDKIAGLNDCVKDDGFIYVPVKSVAKEYYNGALYDLQMSVEHNYMMATGLIHNGGGKRNGSFAIYLEPWHADIRAFLQMRKNHGDEEMKARDLFYALWIPDLFMERVKADGEWTLMCPDECPGLADVYGDEFKVLYETYEKDGKGRESVKARDIWFEVLDAQMETGTPYLLYKDACNRKSNQKNLGTIKSSNLCTEIIEYSAPDETAVCNLASIALPAFIKADNTIDYDELHKVAKMVTYNLNRIIDINYYPTEKTRNSNMRHRPIGIGVQGLADVFMIMGHPFVSEEAKEINRQIFETIYHGALESSAELAQTEGPYSTFAGSPASEGILQFDLWDIDPGVERYDWPAMKKRIMESGLRNSLLLAPMPTASTSQILGYNECIEPITSNIYSRRTIAGEFIMANKYLMKDLMALELWNESTKNSIIANHGSIQHIESIPANIREKYKTVWELPMRQLIDMASDRGAYICQSQSLNLWLEDPNYGTLTSMHFYSWSKGLKTGIYYLRRRAKHQAQQFTIEPEKCEMCSS